MKQLIILRKRVMNFWKGTFLLSVSNVSICSINAVLKLGSRLCEYGFEKAQNFIETLNKCPSLRSGVVFRSVFSLAG